MSRTSSPRAAALIALLLAATTPIPAAGQNTTANEGGDLAFGGPGTEPGKFLELRDIAFDPAGNLYALDGARYDPKTGARTGNLRVQKFTNDGKLLAAIDLSDAATGQPLGTKNDPQRLAVDGRGNVFVTQPAAGRVWAFGPDGKLARTFDVPAAMAVAATGTGDAERVAVIPSRREVVKGKWQWVGGDRVVFLPAGGGEPQAVPLAVPKPLEGVRDAAFDRNGNLYVQAEPNAVYQFDPAGKLVRTLGGNPTTRSEDGSELLHTVAVDSKGNVYTMTWGNPGLVTRFDADGKTVTQRGGQFKWADPWSVHSSYTVLAVDPNDRLWAAATHLQNPKGPHYQTQRAVPAVVRTRPDFFENPPGQVKQSPVRTIGYRPSLACLSSFNVTHEPGKPVPMRYTVAAANRAAKAATVLWQVVDAHKREVDRGSFDLTLADGLEAATDFQFTPPRFGSYFVIARAGNPDGDLGAVGEHVGVTPRWPNMPVLNDGDSKGGWEDPVRQVWTGLPNVRLHPAKGGLDKLDADLTAADAAGATVVVQLFESQKKFDPAEVKAFAERFKGRVKYVEVCNEPNFSGSVDDYFKMHKQVYDTIKAIDPGMKVMGPATVNLDLKWLARLYELGFKGVSDIVSLHDYEGHESISPEHWRWKFAEVRALLAKHGDDTKEVWQTERAISGVRGLNFQGPVQAIRCTLHRDLLETLGVPSAHNNHYYLNQGGYSGVPSYVWSRNGPHPAALALRTRHALTAARGRSFAGAVDFGPGGTDLFLGVRYAGADGETVGLRNLGTRDTPLGFTLTGAAAVEVVDAWGNAATVPAPGGKLPLTLAQLPCYVLLPKGASLAAPRLDFGPNLAAGAAVTYSAATKSDPALLTNGVIETYHNANPHGDTNGQKVWTGEFPGGPQTLELAFDGPRRIDRVVVRGVRADNAFCALLAYDLQYHDGIGWKTVEAVDRPMPPSEAVRSADATAAIWTDDTNFFVHRFPPVTTGRVRLVVRDVTRGFVPDDRAAAWGKPIPQKLMLREVGVYGPAGATDRGQPRGRTPDRER